MPMKPPSERTIYQSLVVHIALHTPNPPCVSTFNELVPRDIQSTVQSIQAC